MLTRNTQPLKRKQAIVIGGGIAGLLAARILIEHFEEVTIVERDSYPQEPIFRPGTPQARQLHSMLLKGQHILEELFPNLKSKLLAHGALERDYGNQALYYYGNRLCPTVPPVLHGWNCSRMLLEWQIRQELIHYSRLHIIEGYEVTNLLFQQDAVVGVQLRERNHKRDNTIHDLKADLVVDASGPSSHVMQWLQDAGYQAPKETVISPQIGYATQFYEPPTTPYDWKGIVIRDIQQSGRGGVLMTIEQGRWMVVLSGRQGDYPPTKSDEFMAFAQSLPHPALYEAIKTATPLSPIYGYRTENRLRHFEQLRKPDGIIIMGDAICNFNPVYGQGMTVAALEAQLLDSYLRKNQKGLTYTFQKKAARLIRSPWRSATSADTNTKGVLHWYMERLITLLPDDPTTFLTVLEVLHMLRHPIVLLDPALILRVLTYRVHSRRKVKHGESINRES